MRWDRNSVKMRSMAAASAVRPLGLSPAARSSKLRAARWRDSRRDVRRSLEADEASSFV